MSTAGALSPNRRHAQRLNALLGIAALAVMVLVTYLIWSGYQEAIQGARTTTRNYAGILEARLDATLRRADAILLELRGTVPIAALSKQAVPRYAREIDASLDVKMVRFTEVAGLRLFDANGDMLYTSDSERTPRTNISDRETFRQLRDGQRAGLVFAKAEMSRATGRPSMAMVRALRDDQGIFRGTVVAVIELDYLKKLFQSLEIGPNGYMNFVRSDDFRMVLRQPPLAHWLNRALPAGTPVRDAISAGNERATLEFPSARTGIEVIASYRMLEPYPFYVVAALGREDVLAGWRGRAQAVGVAGLLLLGLLGGLLIRHRRAEAREARVLADMAESEERFRTLFEQAAVGVALTESATSRVIRINRKFAEFLGYSQAEMLQHTHRSVTHPDDVPLSVAYRQRLNAGELSEFSQEKRYIRKDGSVVWGHVTVSAIRKADGSFDRHVVVVTDINERKRAEEALRDSRDAYQDILATGLDGFLLLDTDGRLIEVNATYLRQSGYSREELLGKRIADLDYKSGAAIARHMRRIMETGGDQFETIHRRKDGSMWHVEISTNYRAARGGQFFAFLRDITERKRQEAELIAARQAAESASLAKTRFLAAASHDLRQPIQAINLFLDALNRTRRSEDQKEISGYLSMAVRSLGDLLSGLLDISKLDAGIVEPRLELTDAENVLRRIEAEFAPLAPEKNLHFRLVSRRKGLALRTDPELLLRILRNIVGNAVKYTERGGILVGTRQRGDRGVIQVWDTGVGVAQEHMSQIFEEYFQISNPERDKKKGLGLGLAIVRRLAGLIAAEVSCRSRLGRGTVFEISLPLAQGPLSVYKSPIPQMFEDRDDLSGFAGRRIVVIDDDVLVAKSIEKSLGALGMAVTAFNDGDDALASSDIADADFYISDFRLPGRLDGVQLLNAIQQRSARPINAVLLTGDILPNQMDLSASSNWDVLFKPVNLSKLLAMMAETTGGWRRPERRKRQA